MKATEELKNEHQGIELMLNILQVISDRLRAGASVDLEHLEGMMEFFTVFVDKCHHGKEEEFLFPALEAASIPREGGPIGVLLSEHVQGRERVARMRDALNLLRTADPAGSGSFRESADTYITLLRQHIHKENNILFVIAESKLDAAKDSELFAAYEQLEEERIGPGKHEAFHAFMHKLQGLYLS